ncbi:LysR substrate-binding domain-containing protein [Chelativorans sp. Marseille-P2723]|uniref:LysR substrate-binding domain-containing protein n=1 Tax=Chelativorans sp. Marseille-P2723 TaxID=2709133 RepID=UPI00156D9BCA|nr:LysR substrate-binding domain-containing protein [Chelativorans sp. Marseille-P2723]
MKMKIHQLHSLVAIVQNGLNVTRTARHMNISQPALTKHIQLLELQLGVSLFVRSKRRLVDLTPPGKELFAHASKVLTAMDDFARAATKLSRQTEQLSIAASPTPAGGLLLSAARSFRNLYPGINLNIRQGSMERSIELLKSGEVDLCLSSVPQVLDEDDLIFLECYKAQWIVVFLKDHHFEGRDFVNLVDLANLPLITYSEGYSSRAKIMNAFTSVALRPNIVFDASDIEAMKKYVRSGLGIAIVNDGTLDSVDRETLTALPLQDAIPPTTIHLGVRRDAILGKSAYHLISLLKPSLDKSVQARLER